MKRKIRADEMHHEDQDEPPRFREESVAVGAGLSLAVPHSRVRGANNDVRVAVVGIRSQGSNHINWFRAIPGVRVVAVCDADKSFLEREQKKFAERNEKVDTYVDYRKLLEDKSIDAVITATPNHWHALVTVWACQAGKDVYVEKPVSHSIWEGRRMVEAARKYNRIVQCGTQRRSDTGLREAIDYVQQGNLGKIRLVRGFVYVRRDSIGKVDGPQPVPASVDYNLWSGPAPMLPLMRKNLHYDWHWVWPTGDGHLSSALCHMGNISYRLGQQASRAEILDRIGASPDMTDAFERVQDHLLLNGVDVKQTARVLGSWLTMDPQAERFTGEHAEEANKLVRGTYREPFVVPEQA